MSGAPISVSLTEAELFQAALVAIQRQVQNLMRGRADAHGAPRERGWDFHIEGAAGEMAVAKHYRRYWNGAIGNLKADDVAGVQVRTRSRETDCLLLHKTDPDDKVFILVTGPAPHFKLSGWIKARDGKRDEHWQDKSGTGRPCFFVPQAALQPMWKVAP